MPTSQAFDRRSRALGACSLRSQFACLRSHVEDVADRVHHAWRGLSRACRHHPCELAPSGGDLQVFLRSASDLQAVFAATTN